MLENMNLDEYYKTWVERIDKQTLTELRKTREGFKADLERIDKKIKEAKGTNSEGKNKFLQHYRRTLRNLLAHVKSCIKSINVNFHNTPSTKHISIYFMKAASTFLLEEIFDEILKKSLELQKHDAEKN